MVKILDDNESLQLDHIGFALWRAAQNWKRDFVIAMEARGFPWHGEACGAVLAHVGPAGISQAALPAAMGASKQAVQQLVDQLEADGVVARAPDRNDKRANRIVLTALGLKDYRERGNVKRQIERKYRRALGEARFAALADALTHLNDLCDLPPKNGHG